MEEIIFFVFHSVSTIFKEAFVIIFPTQVREGLFISRLILSEFKGID